MQAYVWWFVLGFGLVVAELMTGTFFLLVIAIALACAGVAAFFDAPLAVQLVIAAVIGLGGGIVLSTQRRAPRGATPHDATPATEEA